MSDRTTEIREALANIERNYAQQAGAAAVDVMVLMREVRTYADLLDSDPLIIRRDENGEWPEWAIDTMDLLWHEQGAIFSDILDALAAVVDTPKENR